MSAAIKFTRYPSLIISSSKIFITINKLATITRVLSSLAHLSLCVTTIQRNFWACF